MQKPTDKKTISLEEILQYIPKRPSGTVKLPSLGRFYNSDKLKDGQVELCPMTAREEKLIAGIKGNNLDDVIDTLLERCLITDIPINSLILTDRFYLLLMLRAQSYGSPYSYSLECSFCGKPGKYTTNISTDLTIKYAKETDEEPFHTTLPESGLKISFVLQREKDQKEIRNYINKESKKANALDGDPGYLYGIARLIKLVNDRPIELPVAQTLLEKISAKDFIILKDSIDEVTPGVLTVVKKECVNCKEEIEVDMPMTAEFFRPKFK